MLSFWFVLILGNPRSLNLAIKSKVRINIIIGDFWLHDLELANYSSNCVPVSWFLTLYGTVA
jgi:hypothetical protein